MFTFEDANNTDTLYMVPIADMLHHDENPNCFVNLVGDEFRIIALGSILRGEEVGPKRFCSAPHLADACAPAAMQALHPRACPHQRF
jgi:hypothetical protein